MLTRLHIPLLVITTQLHLAANMPSLPILQPNGLKTHGHVTITQHGHAVQNSPPPIPHPHNARMKKAPTIITHHHQLLVPTNLHVIPIQYQNIHSNLGIPHAHTNSSQTTQLIPIYSYIPVQYNHWVPVHELTVIPLNRDVSVQNRGHYRAMERKNDDDDDINRFRRFYGGYGSGLYFGGHGAGHGFHSYYG